MRRYSLYKADDGVGTGVKGLNRISGWFYTIGIITLALAGLSFVLAFLPIGEEASWMFLVAGGASLFLAIQCFIFLPFINAIRTLVINSIKTTQLIEELEKKVKE